MSVPASVDQARQTRDDVTTLLRDWCNGNQSALDRLTPLIYEDLIRLARARLKGERREFTLDPTALVHECYLRLADQTRLDVESRAHFYSIPPVGWRAGSADCIFVPPTWKWAALLRALA